MTMIMPDSDSDFGYDFSAEEEELLLQLASGNPISLPLKSPPGDDARRALDSVPGKTENHFGDESGLESVSTDASSTKPFDSPRTPRGKAVAVTELSQTRVLSPPVDLDQEVTYPDLSRALSDVRSETIAAVRGSENARDDPFEDDGRSPLQKFRSYPKKPLTVTDLTSGAWCELQYWYTLTRLPGGRRTRTAAMKQGSKVHQKLEDEVHTTVKIDIMSKEDGFGLRLWNLIQGLRTLRDTGLTRELEVWGMIEENLVNGVIDGVSYENPNPEFEEELLSQESQSDKRQSSVTDYFPPKRTGKHIQSPKIYLTDVKTRGSTAPVSKALFRPAKIQLLLYHKFLSDMAAGRLDFLKVFRRYGLDPDEPFSDSFIAQIGSLHDEVFVDASQEDLSEYNPSQESSTSDVESDCQSTGPDLLKYRSLRELLALVQQEVELTFPHGEESLGHMLRVQYILRSDGRELDQHDFPVSRQALETYLSKYMQWWRGERKAKGVDIEEAFKCRTCEFVSDCSWRQSLHEDMVRKAQQKVLAARRTLVQ